MQDDDFEWDDAKAASNWLRGRHKVTAPLFKRSLSNINGLSSPSDAIIL